jgi:hypothetical protein
MYRDDPEVTSDMAVSETFTRPGADATARWRQ